MVVRRAFGSAQLRLAVLTLALVAASVPAGAQSGNDRPVTFTRDIAPILQQKCQQCHQPNSIAPMALITYNQVRPYARAIKQRTQQVYVPGMRGVMPPWFIERNIGIHELKDDMALSDAQIATLAKWADNGAPEGNPADMPPPVNLADQTLWFLGKPDLLVTSPNVFVKGVAPDWWGTFGETPTDLPEGRYAKSIEYKETSDVAPGVLPATAGSGKTSIFVFHHATASPRGQEIDAGDEGGGGWGIHEVGRNGEIFPADAGRFVPAKSTFVFNGHVHSPGIPGADRNATLTAGLRFHPTGYKPKYKTYMIRAGGSELEMRSDSDNQRYDGYWVAPQPFKMLNFEPHLHAAGVRMCIEAIYKEAIETLNCVGYDHNWVRNYQYDENAAPLLPKGTILHTIAWFDGTAKNRNVIDPRNTTVFGRRTVQNMFGIFNNAYLFTDDQYQEELAKRRQYLDSTDGWNAVVGCPGCFDPPAQPAAAPSR
jgi:hypothetical protein